MLKLTLQINGCKQILIGVEDIDRIGNIDITSIHYIFIPDQHFNLNYFIFIS